MNHIVLARKWRPKKFADLVGQQHSVTILKNIISSGRLHHAYLLTGTRGVGKTTIARIIAKALNCLNPVDSEPCGTCSNCTQIDVGRFTDVIEIDAASNTGVDNVRELIDDAKYAPTSGRYKIYIIDEVHMLSKSAFNAMLKTLEEPPAHAIFILATTDLQKVPITILSRCLQLKLRNLLAPEIEGHLAYVLTQEQVTFEPQALELLAKAANGSMRDGLSLSDQAIAFSNNAITNANVKTMLGITDNEVTFALLDALSQLDGQKLTAIAKSIYEKGESFENVLSNLREQLCNISLIQLAPSPTSDLTLAKYAKIISVNDIHLYFEIANLGLEQLQRQADKYPIFMMTLLRMLAFNIGTNEQKQVMMKSSNFISTSAPINNNQPVAVTKISNPIEFNNNVTPKQNLSTANTEIVVQNNSTLLFDDDENPDLGSFSISNSITSVATLKEQIDEIPQTPINSEDISNSAAKPYLDDWFNLIIELKNSLGYLYPILENAKLISENAHTFEIMVDNRYQSILNQGAAAKLKAIFDKYFNTTTTLNINFANEVDNTLKAKTTLENQQQQSMAEEAIYSDPNLTKILEQFSATITPGSIKSL